MKTAFQKQKLFIIEITVCFPITIMENSFCPNYQWKTVAHVKI